MINRFKSKDYHFSSCLLFHHPIPAQTNRRRIINSTMEAIVSPISHLIVPGMAKTVRIIIKILTKKAYFFGIRLICLHNAFSFIINILILRKNCYFNHNFYYLNDILTFVYKCPIFSELIQELTERTHDTAEFAEIHMD